jgi:hypothetical protein
MYSEIRNFQLVTPQKDRVIKFGQAKTNPFTKSIKRGTCFQTENGLGET